MPWYKTGTVSVTNGSVNVVGAGTAFIENVLAGDAFRGPDDRVYEVAAVVSATQLTLASNYGGATAAGQRSEDHTSELQSLMRISYAVFRLQIQMRYITYLY